MYPKSTKDTIFNSVVLFAAWLVVISACIGEDVESTKQAVRIAYQAQ
jgi:hypothetical protein